MTLCQNEAEVKCQMDIFGGQSPFEILLLPHSYRGSRQLLLSIYLRQAVTVPLAVAAIDPYVLWWGDA